MAGHPVDAERLRPRLFLGATYTAAAFFFVLAATAQAASPTIYKCLDNRLGLVYTDVPCKDGEKLDIHAGEADPAALARLERIREQLDQSTVLRIVEESRAAATAARTVATSRRDAEEQLNVPQYAAGYAPFDYGYLAYPADARHSMRPRAHKPVQPPHFAPNPPYIVPKPPPR